MKKNIEVYEGLIGLDGFSNLYYAIDNESIDSVVDAFMGKCVRITIEELEEKQ